MEADAADADMHTIIRGVVKLLADAYIENKALRQQVADLEGTVGMLRVADLEGTVGTLRHQAVPAALVADNTV
jgi:hypothetical protein